MLVTRLLASCLLFWLLVPALPPAAAQAADREAECLAAIRDWEPSQERIPVTVMAHDLAFVPRYTRAQCVVNLEVLGDTDIDSPAFRTFFRFANRYFATHSPELFRYVWNFDSANHRFQLMVADGCGRKDTVVRDLAKAFLERFPCFDRLEVVDEAVKPEAGIFTIGGSWIDDGHFDPEYWDRRRRAFEGDGMLLLELARKEEKEMLDYITEFNGGETRNAIGLKDAYIYYALARDHLPSGKARDEAQEHLDRLGRRFPPDIHALANDQVEFYRDAMKLIKAGLR